MIWVWFHILIVHKISKDFFCLWILHFIINWSFRVKWWQFRTKNQHLLLHSVQTLYNFIIFKRLLNKNDIMTCYQAKFSCFLLKIKLHNDGKTMKTNTSIRNKAKCYHYFIFQGKTSQHENIGDFFSLKRISCVNYKQ